MAGTNERRSVVDDGWEPITPGRSPLRPMLIGFGIAFLLPVLLMLVERAGLVTRDQLKRGRRYAILIAFVIAAVATPPDVLSQFMLAVPLILLYELSLIAIWFTERRRSREATSEPA